MLEEICLSPSEAGKEENCRWDLRGPQSSWRIISVLKKRWEHRDNRYYLQSPFPWNLHDHLGFILASLYALKLRWKLFWKEKWRMNVVQSGALWAELLRFVVLNTSAYSCCEGGGEDEWCCPLKSCDSGIPGLCLRLSHKTLLNFFYFHPVNI